MSKNRLIIAALVIFLLLGTTSIAGAATDGVYSTYVSNLNFAPSGFGFVSATFSGLDSSGNVIGFLTTPPNTNGDAVATLLNSAYWQGRPVTLHVFNGYINGVEV